MPSTQKLKGVSEVELTDRTAPSLEVSRTYKVSDLLNQSLGYAIRRAQVRLDEALVSYLNGELSPARLAALSTIAANPGISQVALGGLLSIATPSVVKVIDELERLGLVTRSPSGDRRSYSLQLTRKGAADNRRLEQSVRRFEKIIAGELSDAERAALIDMLARVARKPEQR